MDPQQSVDFNLVTIRQPRDDDNLQLEKRHNGYLPVHIGDVLKDGSYKILHRLGNGLHANIWLAESLLARPRYVALKIFSSHCSEAEINSEFVRTLSSVRDNTSYPSEVREGLHHLVKTLDIFTIPGPMKEHICHVMELVGPSLYSYMQMRDFARLDQPGPWLAEPLPRSSVLALASQIARALVSLQHLGIVHGDLQRFNIAFRFPFDADETLNVEDVYGKPEAILAKDFTSFVEAGFGEPDDDGSEYIFYDENKDTSDEEEDELLSGYGSGTEDEMMHMPQYFVFSPDISNVITAVFQSPPSFQLIDLTCSFQYPDCCNPDSKARIGTPLDYAPPEAHLPEHLHHLFSTASDMWSFGCLLFHVLGGDQLFRYFGAYYQRLPARFYFDVVRILGTEDPIPEPFYRALALCFDGSPRRNMGEKERYSRAALDPGLADFYKTGEWPSECQETWSYTGNLRDRLAKLRKMEGLRDEDEWLEREVNVLCDVIEGCVRWDPEKRLTAKQVVDMLGKADIGVGR